MNIKLSTVIKKCLFIVIIFSIIALINDSITPIVSTQMALKQMSNSIDSNMWIRVYSNLQNYSFVFYIAIFVLVFLKEIKKLFKFIIKGENKDEK